MIGTSVLVAQTIKMVFIYDADTKSMEEYLATDIIFSDFQYYANGFFIFERRDV